MNGKCISIVKAIVFVVGYLWVSHAYAQMDLDEMTSSLGNGISDFLTLAIQIITVVVFFVVGYGVVSKFMEAVGGRTAWAEVLVPVLVGAFVLVACAYFFTEAQTLADAIGGGEEG